MKRTVLSVLLVISLLLVFSCKTQQPAPAPVEATFSQIFERYAGALILDGATTYTVVAGNTLSGISHSVYDGNGFFYPVIMLANSDTVTDMDKIQLDQELIIPDLEANLADDGARTAIKGFLLEVADLVSSRGLEDTAQGLRDLSDSL